MNFHNPHQSNLLLNKSIYHQRLQLQSSSVSTFKDKPMKDPSMNSNLNQTAMMISGPVKGLTKIKRETRALVKGMKGLVTKQNRHLKDQNRIAEDIKYDNNYSLNSSVDDEGTTNDPYMSQQNPLKIKDANLEEDHGLSTRICDKMHSTMMKMQGKWQVNEMKQIDFQH